MEIFEYSIVKQCQKNREVQSDQVLLLLVSVLDLRSYRIRWLYQTLYCVSCSPKLDGK